MSQAIFDSNYKRDFIIRTTENAEKQHPEMILTIKKNHVKEGIIYTDI